MHLIGLDLLGEDWGAAVKKAAPKVLDAASSYLKEDDKAAPAKKDDKKPDDKKGGGDSGGESFLSKTVIGPVKVWMAGVLVALGGGGVWYWKFRKK